MRYVIGARKSDLARVQAYAVGAQIQRLHPEVEIEYLFKTSLGDRNLTDPLWKAPEKGLFTEDFLADLRSGACDLVVHSWKDLPTAERSDTLIFSASTREDVRDVLLMKPSSVGKQTLTMMSSSPRRSHNLSTFFQSYLPGGAQKIQWMDVRGNVPTRIKKLLSTPQADGLIVAKAALDRLLTSEQEEFQETRTFLRSALEALKVMVLPLRLNPTAAAQGALALEVRRDRPELHKILSSLQGEAVATCIQKERDRLTGFGGGCHLKIGITRIERPYGQLEFVCGQTPEGEDLKELNYFPAFIAPEAAAGKTWPQSPKERGTSKRVALEVGPEQEYLDKGYNGLYVARTEALPSGWEPARFEWVWTAGLSTWRKLAEKGVWVHGSSESLGEKEDMRLGALSRAPLKWVKVTHAEAGPSRPEVLTLSTYEVQLPMGVGAAAI